jgi:hypothetical protein
MARASWAEKRTHLASGDEPVSLAALLRYGPTIIAALAVVGFIWWIGDLQRENARLTDENARLTRNVQTITAARDQAREAARVAEAYRQAAEAKAREYEHVRDAFREGDFDAPLPPEFRAVLDGLLGRPD